MTFSVDVLAAVVVKVGCDGERPIERRAPTAHLVELKTCHLGIVSGTNDAPPGGEKPNQISDRKSSLLYLTELVVMDPCNARPVTYSTGSVNVQLDYQV